MLSLTKGYFVTIPPVTLESSSMCTELQYPLEMAAWNPRKNVVYFVQDDILFGFDVAAYKKDYPELAAEFERRMKGELPNDWDAKVAEYIAGVNAEAFGGAFVQQH